VRIDRRQQGDFQPRGIGDLKLFEPKTRCLFLAVRDREERQPGLV
jgi:hypothetical protein